MAFGNLSAPFIRRPIGTSLLAMGLFLVGIVARLNLPVAPLPQVELPIIFSNALEPGASPETMAATVAAPLERRFGQIAGVNEMTSYSSLGNTFVLMQFDGSKDVDAAARDVAAAINAAGADLPAGLPTAPFYKKANPNNQPIMILALTSKNHPLSEVYNVADSLLSQRIAQVPGVSQVDLAGGAKPAVRIQVDGHALAAMNLSMDDVRTAISQLSAKSPLGSLGNESQNYTLAINDQLHSADDFRNLIIRNSNNIPVPLSSVAKVFNGQEDLHQAGWFNKQRAVLMLIRKSSDANVIKTIDGIKALLPLMRTWLPPGIDLDIQVDRTQTIRASVRDVQFSLFISIALVILVMLLFLRRGVPTAIAGVTVPLSIAGTFVVMWFCGFTIDNFSLMAITISVGLIVDDAIVVIENIVRHIERGVPPLEAALEGGREISFTVLSMSISLIAVFIPVLFLGGIIGKFFREFSVTLTSAIAVSGVVSLTLTPSLCARFLKADSKVDEPSNNFIFRAAEHSFDRMLKLYRVGLDWSLKHSKFMLLVTLATVFLTFYLYSAVDKGFLPEEDTGVLQVSTEGGEDTSFENMEIKQQAVADIVLKDPDVVSLASFLGGRNSANDGQLYVSLRTKDDGRKLPASDIINRLRPKLQTLSGIRVTMQQLGDLRNGTGNGKAQYEYTIHSPNLKDLYTWVPKIVAQLRKSPKLKDVTSDLEQSGLQMNVVINRDSASRLGITPAAIDQAVDNAFGQRQIGIIYTELNEYRVVLEVDPSQQQDPSSLDRIYVKGASGDSVPLSAIAHFEVGNTPLEITHKDQYPVVNVDFNVTKGVSLSEATAVINQAMIDLHVPGEVQGGFAGNAQLFVQSLKTLPLLLLTALLTLYIVLGMLYESLIHALTILSTLPSAGIGALLALMATGTDLSIVSIIGIILLIGIVKKNAIMMVDFALDAERRFGMTPQEAIYEACVVRFRPIMMTTMAALFGALPLALGTGTGAELRRPLGIAVVGGLALSQLLTLFTTPVVYLALERLSKASKNRRAARRARKLQAAAAPALPHQGM